MKLKRIILAGISFFLIANLVGCEAFIRKFTRKKKTKIRPEELVLEPETYRGPEMSREELYRQHFVYWRSWSEELIIWLVPDSNYKKRVDCAEEALENLLFLRSLLDEDKSKELDVYISRLTELKDAVVKDRYGDKHARNRQTAERLGRSIMRDFSFANIKNNLI
ncbi:hypothetical protein ACFLZ3_04045 [Candidatus Omnitrophota bacterium]